MANRINLDDIGIKPDTKIYRFPSTVGNLETDASGQEQQYMLIQISTSTKGSLMGSDATVPPGAPSPEDQRPSFGDTLPNKSFNMFGGVSEISTAIALPMPANYTVNSVIGYDNKFEPSNASKVADFAMGSSSVVSKLKGAAVFGILNSISKGGLINSITGDKKQTQASQRIAQNPMKEVTFEGMDFREFNFEYIFSPNSVSEAAILREIIATLRYYSLPELALGRLYFIFPGVFRFRFMIGSRENIWIPAVGTSVINQITVNYSANGQTWSSFPQGQPVFIKLSINITEIEILDRTRVSTSDSKGGF